MNPSPPAAQQTAVVIAGIGVIIMVLLLAIWQVLRLIETERALERYRQTGQINCYKSNGGVPPLRDLLPTAGTESLDLGHTF